MGAEHDKMQHLPPTEINQNSIELLKSNTSFTEQGNVDERLAVAFDMHDISDDGQIDQKELTNMISAIYDLNGETDRQGDREPKKRAQQIISALDVGNDKKISKQEFITGCKADPIICHILAPFKSTSNTLVMDY
ncbi:unnamed protein product [Didymodactylos carnosus]|uniref:EF-hand domain-containing protein n=1 Tax=Didymodactylos carnosus TaxID=1234261 RepID=A0A8S2EH59_9BILA|nr:unnamed protein product [Didymodactylos carnosus]CAF3951225.1 unnamed protein product [Didymodactylos carnosus]